MAVSERLVPFFSPEQGGPSRTPGMVAPAEMSLHRRNGVLTFDGRKQRQLVSQGCFKRRLSCSGGGVAVMRVLNPWKLFTPGRLVMGRDAVEGRLKLLGSMLRLSIALWKRD